jgi:hypothetical protein
MSCLTIAFHATKRSMSTSEGRRSFVCVCLWMRERERETVVPVERRDVDVAREMEAASL